MPDGIFSVITKKRDDGNTVFQVALFDKDELLITLGDEAGMHITSIKRAPLERLHQWLGDWLSTQERGE